MKSNKLISLAIILSLATATYPTGTVYAQEETTILEDNTSITAEEIEIAEEESIITEEENIFIEDNPIVEDEMMEEELLDEEKSTPLTSVIITTTKTISLCTEDNEIVDSEIEISKCELTSEDGMTLEQVRNYAFSAEEESPLIKMEENAFLELSLPDDISSLKITFLVNEYEDKIISIKCSY